MSKTILLTIISIFIVSGCGSSKPPPRPPAPRVPPPPVTSSVPVVSEGKDSQTTLPISTRGLPEEWYVDRPIAEDRFYGVGEGKAMNPSLAKKMATAMARDELSQSIQIQVDNIIKIYMQQSGTGSRSQALNFAEAVTEQSASQAVSYSIVEKSEVGRDNTFYVLVSCPVEQVREIAVKVAKQTLDKDEALYTEFKAREGFKALEAKIRELNGLQNP